MQALLTEAPGGWNHTRVAEVAEPSAGPDQVLVEIRAAGLNPADRFLIEGAYPGGPRPPFIAGRDAAGVVLQGDDRGRWSAGTPVVVLQSTETDLAHGTFCERQRFAAGNLAPLPDGWSFAEGAAAPLVYQTAWKALVDRGGLQPGQVVLVTGASGGVGLAAVQLAHGLGATIVALSRSEASRDRLRELGAHYAFAPDAADLKDQVFDAIGRKGIDVVVENVGGSSLGTSVHLLGAEGRVCVVGLLAGVEGTFSIPSLLFKRAAIHGILVSEDAPQEASSAWQEIVDILERHGAKPVVDSRFPLAEYQSAFHRLKSGAFGKVVFER